MTDVDWRALRDHYEADYDSGVAELRAAASRFRRPVDLDDDALRAALADLFDGLADDAETTGPDPRAVSVARSLAALDPRSLAALGPRSSQVEPFRPVPDEAPGAGSAAVRAGVRAVAHGRAVTRADLVIARAAVAVAEAWHRLRGR